ncbi:MAG: hypothetical protein IID53_04830 [Proteobacteria bacterium]|nr:hypothetical protein [Pseudomonadota bacterium]
MRKFTILSALVALTGVAALGIQTASAAVCVNDATADTCSVPGDHATIQAAVTAAGPDDTIVVASGTYVEGVTVPAGKDGLKIQGANAAIPAGRVPGIRGAESIVDGGFLLQSDAVEIDGFTIENGATLFGGGSIGGVLIASDNDVVKNNIFDGDGTGCSYPAVHHSSGNGLQVQNNEIFDWCQGVFLNPSSGHIIEDNNFHDNAVGIGSDGQSSLTVQFNEFSSSAFDEGIGMGTAGTGIVINNNNFRFNDAINHYGGNPVDGSNNYWDCEEGPGQVAGVCTAIGGSSPGQVSFSPWLCTAYPNPDGVTNDVLGALCPPPPPVCEPIIESISLGNPGLQAIDQACCAVQGAALIYDDPESDVDTHGDYVSCVVHQSKLSGFRGNSDPRGGTIAKAAAQSSVNK